MFGGKDHHQNIIYASLALLVFVALGFNGVVLYYSLSGAQAASVVTAEYQDNNGDGTIDHIVLTFNEDVTSCSYDAADWMFTTTSTLNLSITGVTCTGADSVLTLNASADTGETGAYATPVLQYSNAGTPDSIILNSGAWITTPHISVADAVVPYIVEVWSCDLDTDGYVERFEVTFSEEIDDSTIDGSEFIGDIDSQKNGIGDQVMSFVSTTIRGCDIDENDQGVEDDLNEDRDDHYITVSTTSELEGTDKKYLHIADGATILDLEGNAVQVDTAVGNELDYAAPVLLATQPEDDESDADDAARIILTFSEAMDTYFSEGREYSISPDPGSFSETFNSQGTEVTMTPDQDYACDTEYTLTFSLADIDAASGEVTDMHALGPINEEIMFRTNDCNIQTNEDEQDDAIEDNEALHINEDVSAEDQIIAEEGMYTGEVIVLAHPRETVLASQIDGIIQVEGFDTIYFVDTKGARHPVMNEKVFYTWETDFSGVEVVALEEASNYPLGDPIPPLPGTVLVKVSSDPRVYLVTDNEEDPFASYLQAIDSETVARNLIGDDWADYVIDIDVALFPRFETGPIITHSQGVEMDLTQLQRRDELTAVMFTKMGK